MRGINWINIFIGALGFGLLFGLLMVADIHIGPLSPLVAVLLLIAFWLAIAYVFGIRRKLFSVQADERMGIITDKSARNGLIITWLGLFVFVFSEPSVSDTTTLLASIIFAGLTVFLASFVIYYYKGD